MGAMVKVAEVTDLPAGKGMQVDVGGQPVALFNVDGTYYAIGNSCTHVGGSLSEGTLEGTTVTCPRHGAQFDVASGQVLRPPAGDPVPSYKVEVDGDDIKIEVP